MAEISFRTILKCSSCKIAVEGIEVEGETVGAYCPSCEVRVDGERYRRMYRQEGEYLRIKKAREVTFRIIKQSSIPSSQLNQNIRQYLLDTSGSIRLHLPHSARNRALRPLRIRLLPPLRNLS